MYQGLITIYLLQYIHWCELATNILKSTSDTKLETKKKLCQIYVRMTSFKVYITPISIFFTSGPFPPDLLTY